MKFWGSGALATGVFLTYLVPDTLLFIPLFKIVRVVTSLGIELINHWWTMIILYPTLTVPFCTWIMIGYFASIPKELDEAALIDGAELVPDADQDLHPGGDARHHRRDDLRLHRVVGRISSIRWPSLPLRPARAAGRHRHDADQGRRLQLGQIMTGALLGAAPPLIIYAFLMDYYIAGLTAGATKG